VRSEQQRKMHDLETAERHVYGYKLQTEIGCANSAPVTLAKTVSKKNPARAKAE
jgi:hypothetical protein